MAFYLPRAESVFGTIQEEYEPGNHISPALASPHHDQRPPRSPSGRTQQMEYTTHQMYRNTHDDLLTNHQNPFFSTDGQFRSDSLEPETTGYNLFAQNSFAPSHSYRTNVSSTSSLAHNVLNGDPASAAAVNGAASFTHHTYSEPVAAGYHHPTAAHSFDLMNPLSAYNSGNISPLTPVDVGNHHTVAFGSSAKDNYPLDPVLPPLGTNSYLHEQQPQQQHHHHHQNGEHGAHAVQNTGYFTPSAARPAHITPGLDQYSSHLSAVPQHLLHHAPQNVDMMFDTYGLDYRTAVSTPTDDSRPSSGFVPDVSVHVEPLSRLRLQPSDPPQDFQTLIKPYLDQYLRAPNRLALGERTIIVMTSRVAQKSYKTEKRFLCPPPTAILIGNAWWKDHSNPDEPDGKLVQPSVNISISGEVPAAQECTTDWTNAVGKQIDSNNPPSGTCYIGHGMGKQLFISDADERRKRVEALVTVRAPPSANGEGPIIGTFPSRPIKVISKPSKKRQSAKNVELCINHGSIVSLFHRLRSQTVSTKYLCVSGSSSCYKGSDGKGMPGLEQRPKNSTPSFVARTTAWDCFVIYIVDTSISVSVDAQPPAPLQPHYPAPPPNAVSISPQPIYYNQLVVLQCLTSGVVSPVLIIRKIDHQTTVVGGGMQDGAKPVSSAYCAPGEVCGDPVSQLHKVAFEVYEPDAPPPAPGTPGVSSAFLSCVSEKVNTTRPQVDRQWITTVTPPSPISPSALSGELFGRGDSAPSSPIIPADLVTNDGGKVRKRRAASNASMQKPVSKGGRRVSPASSIASAGSRLAAGSDGLSALSGSLWNVDVGESSCWTIVNVDQVRYNFYIPPITNLYPIPRSPVTPFPAIVKYLPPDRATEVPKCNSSTSRMTQPHPQASKLLTVYGENFPKDDSLQVYFGNEPSSYLELRCTEVLACMPPSSPNQTRPMLLVRGDGVVFPSSISYP